MAADSLTQVDKIEAIPENLFREPIDYLYADHFRQRVVCKFLDDIAQDPEAGRVPELAVIVLDYLMQDLPQHIADEEKDLFPRLRTRCKPEDQVERVLLLLSEEHARDQDVLLALPAGLRSLIAGRPLQRPELFVQAASTFAECQRRHLAWEEGVILPLARKRLGPEDLAGLGRSMAARRGVTYPE
jgi:hemerythrin-like domain-containing protein